MIRIRIKGFTIIIGLVFMLSFTESNAEVNPNPSWTVDDPVIFHAECKPYDYYAAKDPTIVYYKGNYLVYYTGANQSGGWQMCFTTATTIPELKTAKRTYMSKIGEPYFCAPELFYFEPQNLWYLVYQDGTFGAAFSTSSTPDDPASWSGPKSFNISGSMGWDYYVICDDQYAYLYNTPGDNSGNLYVRKTTLADFPDKGWSAPTIAASKVFEAAEVYKSISDGQYYLLVEAMIDGRSYELFKSSSAGGPWTLVNDKWATRGNLTTYRGTKWTTNVSHGEFIRAGYNQKLEINDINKVDFLIQGTTNLSGDYQKIIWDLGLIRNYSGPQQPPNTNINTDTGTGTVNVNVNGTCPCDIYAAGGTPCVAAHSTVRALYSSYNGPLYQVRRTSDNKTKDIGVLTSGGLANSAVQDSFLNGSPGTISKIYDQSPKGNHLLVTPPGGWLSMGGKESNATDAKIKVNGHTVYGIYINPGNGYRNNNTSGIATGDQPEGMYAVIDGKRYNQKCCFDYGNAETNSLDNGNGTMEAIYFGTSTDWGRGSGTGPWIMADLENGLFAGQSFAAPPSNTSFTCNYVTAIIKGNSGNHFAIRGGNAQSGSLKTLYDGPRPNGGYNPMKKEGAIVLGTGGDNSWAAIGTFFEGCMTSGYPSDAAEDAVQANIVAAGYGSTITATRNSANDASLASSFKVRYNPSNANAIVSYILQDTRHVSMKIVDQQGRQIAAIVNSVIPAGRHEAVWNAKQVPVGVYLWRIMVDGKYGWAGKVAIGK